MGIALERREGQAEGGPPSRGVGNDYEDVAWLQSGFFLQDSTQFLAQHLGLSQGVMGTQPGDSLEHCGVLQFQDGDILDLADGIQQQVGCRG